MNLMRSPRACENDPVQMMMNAGRQRSILTVFAFWRQLCLLAAKANKAESGAA